MFEELIPLLAQRTVLLTLPRVSDHKIRVNVIPKPVKSDLRDDNTALTTPLAVTGTPKELDEQLSSQLVEFVGTHLELSSTLKECEGTDGCSRQSSKGSGQEIGQREIAQRVQQCDSKPGASANRDWHLVPVTLNLALELLGVQPVSCSRRSTTKQPAPPRRRRTARCP